MDARSCAVFDYCSSLKLMMCLRGLSSSGLRATRIGSAQISKVPTRFHGEARALHQSIANRRRSDHCCKPSLHGKGQVSILVVAFLITQHQRWVVGASPTSSRPKAKTPRLQPGCLGPPLPTAWKCQWVPGCAALLASPRVTLLATLTDNCEPRSAVSCSEETVDGLL